MLKLLSWHPAAPWAVLAAVAVLSGFTGWKLRDGDYQAHLKADAEAAATAQSQARSVEAKNEKTAAEVGAKVEKTVAEVRYVTREIIKEVPVYVTVQADANCVVPVGAVELLNAAASGRPPAPDPSGRSVDAPSGVDLSAVAGTVVENYGYTRELEAQVRGWQEWYARVQKDWPQ